MPSWLYPYAYLSFSLALLLSLASLPLSLSLSLSLVLSRSFSLPFLGFSLSLVLGVSLVVYVSACVQFTKPLSSEGVLSPCVPFALLPHCAASPCIQSLWVGSPPPPSPPSPIPASPPVYPVDPAAEALAEMSAASAEYGYLNRWAAYVPPLPGCGGYDDSNTAVSDSQRCGTHLTATHQCISDQCS